MSFKRNQRVGTLGRDEVPMVLEDDPGSIMTIFEISNVIVLVDVEVAVCSEFDV